MASQDTRHPRSRQAGGLWVRATRRDARLGACIGAKRRRPSCDRQRGMGGGGTMTPDY